MKDTTDGHILFAQRNFSPLTRAIAVEIYKTEPGRIITFDELAPLAGLTDGREFVRTYRTRIVTARKALREDYSRDFQWLVNVGLRRLEGREVADVVGAAGRKTDVNRLHQRLDRINRGPASVEPLTIEEQRVLDQERNYLLAVRYQASDAAVRSAPAETPVTYQPSPAEQGKLLRAAVESLQRMQRASEDRKASKS